jgi:hypothetical protein
MAKTQESPMLNDQDLLSELNRRLAVCNQFLVALENFLGVVEDFLGYGIAVDGEISEIVGKSWQMKRIFASRIKKLVTTGKED